MKTVDALAEETLRNIKQTPVELKLTNTIVTLSKKCIFNQWKSKWNNALFNTLYDINLELSPSISLIKAFFEDIDVDEDYSKMHNQNNWNVCF